jgi:Spy/CpxP family protein refolding chaperone
MESNKTKREAAVLVLVVFVLGLLLGVAGNHVWGERVWGRVNFSQDVHPSRNQVIDDLTHKLELTPEQQTKLASIVDDTRSKWDALYAPLEPEKERIRLEGRQRIRALLTPDQQKKYDVFTQHLDEQRKKPEPR